MMGYKWRLIPVNFQNIPAIEAWLSNLAEKGLFLASCGNYLAKFETAEPAKAAYRLEPASNVLIRTDPDSKKNQFYQEFGWEYVCTFGAYFHVYRSVLENPPEIHTDPKGFADAFRRIVCAQAFSALLYFVLLLFFCHDTLSLINIVRMGAPFMLCFMVFVAIPVISVIRFLQMYRTYRRLKSGIHMEHPSDYRGWLPLRSLLRISPLLCIAIVYFSLFGLRYINKGSGWQEITETLPIVSLMEIEEASTQKSLPTHGRANIAHFQQTFLAPEQYTFRQDANIIGRRWAEDGGAYNPSLIVETYRLRFPILAEPTLHSLIKDYTRNDTWETEVLEVSSTEEACLYTSLERPWWKQAFLRAGDTVICVDYRGESDILPFLPEFAVLAQADFPVIEPEPQQ